MLTVYMMASMLNNFIQHHCVQEGLNWRSEKIRIIAGSKISNEKALRSTSEDTKNIMQVSRV